MESRVAATDEFFDERSDQSAVKSRIVVKFFATWSNVIVQSAKQHHQRPRLAYVDLFAGPGRYSDGAMSTPLLVMEKVIATPDLAENLISTFNDIDPEHTASLVKALAALPGYDELKHKPEFFSDFVDERFEALFANTKLVPTFSFIDPFGYKGVTIGLIKALAKDWGSDCVFFFNYRRINSAITNDAFRPHMEALFGRERLERMRDAVRSMKAWERVEYTLGMVSEVLKEHGFEYSLDFRFMNEAGTRTTHALIYATKHPLGFGIMKEIMAAESSTSSHGVPSYTYSPADAAVPELDFFNPIEDLARDLQSRFTGRTVTVDELIGQDEPKTRFLKKNYRDAILMLEQSGKIIAHPPAGKRQQRYGKPTCGPKVVLQFPDGGQA
jgi:three-Cys-motif partner protein